MFEIIIDAYRWFFLQLAGVVGLGWGIVALSFITSAAMMPLMKAVAGVVRRETEYQSVILPQIADINKRYATDMERNLHVQRLYARYAYSPLSAVKKVLLLFVQIPFLLLTYFMLKGTAQLSGVSFLFLRNLGEPDALALGFNMLPFVMTGVNLVTVFATPGFTCRDQTQAIGIALLFLVMLYTAPSALLLYWTLNNTITCVRTLVAQNGAGSKLLAGRILSLRILPSLVVHKATPATIASASMIFALAALFLFFTCKYISNDMPAGFTTAVSSRGMIILMGFAAFASLVLMRRESGIVKIVAWICDLLAILYPFALICLFLFARYWYRDSMVGLDPLDGCVLLIVLFFIPYLCVAVKNRRDIMHSLVAALHSEWWLLALPIILGIHYSYASAGFILPARSVVVLCLYLAVSCAVMAAVFIIMFQRWIFPSTIARAVFGVVIGYYLVPMISNDTGVGLFAYQSNVVLRLAIAALLSVGLLIVRNRRLLMVFICILGMSVVVNAVMNASAEGRKSETESADSAVAHKAPWNEIPKCARKNNVYLLVYDGYAQSIVREAYGLNKLFDADQYLAENGFTVYEAYSTGTGTVETMASVFVIGGIGGVSDRSTLAGDNPFIDFLQSNGYSTAYIVCGYELPNKGERMPADYYFPSPAKITMPENILYRCILEGFLSQSARVFNAYTSEEWFAAKDSAIDRMGESQGFVYAHTGLPGHNNWSPRYRKSDEVEQAEYTERFVKANDCIRKDVERLAASGRLEDSIVIVASDHGGFLTQPKKPRYPTPFEILDRAGVLMAVHWPKDYRPTLKLNCIQNLMLEVMIYLTGDESLKSLAMDGESHPIIFPFETPAGFLKDGIIQFGPHRGKSIFKAAEDEIGMRDAR